MTKENQKLVKEKSNRYILLLSFFILSFIMLDSYYISNESVNDVIKGKEIYYQGGSRFNATKTTL